MCTEVMFEMDTPSVPPKVAAIQEARRCLVPFLVLGLFMGVLKEVQRGQYRTGVAESR